MTPMDYFLWIYVKNKVYVKNYENIGDLISAIILAFFNHGELRLTTGDGPRNKGEYL